MPTVSGPSAAPGRRVGAEIEVAERVDRDHHHLQAIVERLGRTGDSLRGPSGRSPDPTPRWHARRQVPGGRGEDIASVEGRGHHREAIVGRLERMDPPDAPEPLGRRHEQAVVRADEDIAAGDLDGDAESLGADARIATATCVPTGNQGRPYQSASEPARMSKADTLAVRSMTGLRAMVRMTPRQMAVARVRSRRSR
jgi:hypothetical protein